MELFSIFGAFLVAVVCFVIGLFLITSANRPAEARHHHSIGYGLGCGWVFLLAALVAVGLGLLGLFGGGD